MGNGFDGNRVPAARLYTLWMNETLTVPLSERALYMATTDASAGKRTPSP